MTIGTAILLTLTATFLLAFWYQVLKHLRGYPLAGFVTWLYISSFLTILAANEALGVRDMLAETGAELAGKGLTALGVCLGGAATTYGLTVPLIHTKESGMIANQAIPGMVGVALGLVLTLVVGGLSKNVSLFLILLSAVVLIGASAILQYSSVIKEGVVKRQEQEVTAEKLGFLKKQNRMLILSNVLVLGYSVAYMLGTKSDLHPNEFPAPLCVLPLSIGSLFAASGYAAVSLTRNHQWRQAVLPLSKLSILTALGAGICHYGGNLMQIYALSLLSAPASNLLLKTSSLWTYLWGAVHGEYKGATRKSRLYLALGIDAYAVGIVILIYALYA